MILDNHIHMLPLKNSAEENRKELLASMARVGVSGGAILSPDPTEFAAMGADERIRQVVELCGKGNNLYPFYWVNPTSDSAVDEVEAAVKEGISGFKITCSGYFPSNEGVLAVCRRAAELNKPVLFHSGILWDGRDSSRYNRPGEFECLLEIPKLRFALAHMSWPWFDECLAVYGKFDNAHALRPDLSCEMFIDVTPGTPKNYRERVFRTFFEGDYTFKYNILFGTDCNTIDYNEAWVTEWVNRDNGLYERFFADDLKDTKDHFYYKNLLRFLGLSDEIPQKNIPLCGV